MSRSTFKCKECKTITINDELYYNNLGDDHEAFHCENRNCNLYNKHMYVYYDYVRDNNKERSKFRRWAEDYRKLWSACPKRISIQNAYKIPVKNGYIIKYVNVLTVNNEWILGRLLKKLSKIYKFKANKYNKLIQYVTEIPEE